MPKSFTGKTLEDLARGKAPSGLPQDLIRRARRKLFMLESATDLRDLLSPPGNQLEALKGDRLGQYSIRINDQWRVCFKWEQGRATELEITDYH